ncbi:MAG: protein kinase [Kofleriaceae bacterium]|nr:protein kinase [Kofleriaceae bacterium]
MASQLELDKTATAHARVLPAASEELPAGMRLGHFQLVKKLGAGGMGEVYLATDLALDRPVAIKVLPSTTTSGAARERLIREARAQARVQHPNVAHIYFIGEDAGRLYFAMEYVTGATLADASAPLPVEDALRIVHDAVLGLREAQRSGFTHRDVKPSNLMVDGHGVVKVLDFGIAAGGSDGQMGDGPVAQTTLAGTPLYMAPEQARGEPIDFRADIYALGATLFLLVSGKPPFQAENVAQLITLHETAARPAIPRGIVPRTQGSALDALIARMMAPDPGDRFASYDELLRAIENVSLQYTRPGGFWARMIATGVDLVAMLIVLGLVKVVLPADRTIPVDSIGMTLLAVAQSLLFARFGTTGGYALFELEVANIETGKRPTLAQALRRTAFVFGPILLFGWLDDLLGALAVPDVIETANSVVFGVVCTLNIVHLAYSSLRTPGKRTWWDRRARTIVRYRR